MLTVPLTPAPTSHHSQTRRGAGQRAQGQSPRRVPPRPLPRGLSLPRTLTAWATSSLSTAVTNDPASGLTRHTHSHRPGSGVRQSLPGFRLCRASGALQGCRHGAAPRASQGPPRAKGGRAGSKATLGHKARTHTLLRAQHQVRVPALSLQRCPGCWDHCDLRGEVRAGRTGEGVPRDRAARWHEDRACGSSTPHPKMDGQHSGKQRSHTTADRTSSALSPSPRSASARPAWGPGRAPVPLPAVPGLGLFGKSLPAELRRERACSRGSWGGCSPRRVERRREGGSLSSATWLLTAMRTPGAASRASVQPTRLPAPGRTEGRLPCAPELQLLYAHAQVYVRFREEGEGGREKHP